MWFTETPWPPIVACFVLSAMLWIAWNVNRRGIYLIGIGFLLVAAGAVYAVERQIVTEREQIEIQLLEFTTAFQQGNVSQTLDFIAADATLLRATAIAATTAVTVEDDLRITDVQVQLEDENTRAISHFRANATISLPMQGNLGYRTSRWELEWRKTDADWKAVSVRRLHPITGKDLGILEAIEL